MRIWTIVSLASAGLLIAPAALGATSIVWNAPSGCPDAEQVQATIESMVSQPSTSREGADFVARGSVTQIEGRFELRMRIDSNGASETKVIDGDACSTLAEAYVVAVAFALDPSANIPSGFHLQAVAKPPENRPASPPSPSVPASGSSIGAGPFVALGVGMLPSPAIGVGARISIERTIRWELAGTYWPERSASASADSFTPTGGGARLQLESVEPSACLSFANRRALTCVGGSVGGMQGTGTNIAKTTEGKSWWLAATAAIAGRVDIARWAYIGVRLEVGVPIFRPNFALLPSPSDSVSVFRPAAVFAAVSLEPEFRFSSTDSEEAEHVGR